MISKIFFKQFLLLLAFYCFSASAWADPDIRLGTGSAAQGGNVTIPFEFVNAAVPTEATSIIVRVTYDPSYLTLQNGAALQGLLQTALNATRATVDTSVAGQIDLEALRFDFAQPNPLQALGSGTVPIEFQVSGTADVNTTSLVAFDGTQTSIQLVGGGAATAPDVVVGAVNPPVITIAATDAAADEVGPDTGTFRISRTLSTATPLEVNVNITGTATAVTDYAQINSPITIPANDPFIDITVTPADDADDEPAETVIATIAAPNDIPTPPSTPYTIGAANNATVNIAASDNVVVPVLPTVTLTTTNPTATTPGSFTITRTGSTATALMINVTVGGSAIPGTDYTAITSPITIPAGQSSINIPVTPIGPGAGDVTMVINANALVYSLGAGVGPLLVRVTAAPVVVGGNPANIPTLSEWVMILMLLALFLVGFKMTSRRSF